MRFHTSFTFCPPSAHVCCGIWCLWVFCRHHQPDVWNSLTYSDGDSQSARQASRPDASCLVADSKLPDSESRDPLDGSIAVSHQADPE
ncbi:unnamed protein product [Protopolystoma xenopodis]|uniref:Uncharacterized protein n=1 Tax=Protopolystoma xenopodis TaxID=117903 RepID=A0A3S5BE20_9PLAT|nr:unnamed protein product [Protopolystoma xenopodis]